MKKLALVLALLALSTLVLANPGLKQEFTRTFESHYESNRCGDNILGLVGRAYDNHLAINNANILEIVNSGFSMFGMVHAEYARENGRHGAAGEANWYHHVILEKDGLIYDFAFGNTPQVLPVKQYFEKMFLNELPAEQGGDFYVGRDEKLTKYKITVKPAVETMLKRRQRQVTPDGVTMKMNDYLKQF